MSRPLRVLIIEDNPDDAELVLRQLSRAGFDVSSERVEDEEGLVEALDAAEWDVILADYNLPSFSGLEAVRIVSDRDTEVPLILVSGAIDVPTALVAIKAGARDFILKDDTQRLPSVVEREVKEAADRRARRVAEAERDLALNELRESSEQLAAFAALADVAIGGVTLTHLVGDLLERIVGAARADGAAILLLEGDRLVARGAIGPTAGLELEAALGATFTGMVAAEDRAIYVGDIVAEGLGHDPAVGGCGVCSTIGVPLHYAGRVCGVLHVDWCAPFEPPPWELPLLEIAADRCATIIENARLFEQEHAIAQTLQEALLSAPTTIPRLGVGQFYASATIDTLVGGDFYDVFELDAGKIAFTVGDVSGKGLGAATVTALVKNALRTLAVEWTAPNDVLARANDVVTRFTASEVFVTAVFGVLDVASGVLLYSGAGHPPPAVVGPAGVRMLTSHGPLLGTLTDWPYPVEEVRLAEGESLVLYTDGITEARSPDDVFFGEGRLQSLLAQLADSGASSQDMADRLFDTVWDFSGGRLRDDVAILVLTPRRAGE